MGKQTAQAKKVYSPRPSYQPNNGGLQWELKKSLTLGYYWGFTVSYWLNHSSADSSKLICLTHQHKDITNLIFLGEAQYLLLLAII